ncbi:Ribose operon repressor [compost metagenome]
MQAVKQTIERSGVAEMIEIYGDFEKSGGEQAAEIILRQQDGPGSEPVAVFCLNDEMAVGFYNRMAQSELTIGKDIHIVGFDNIELAQYIQPRLTTIDYSKRKWGAVAAEQVLKIIAGEDVEHERLYVTLVQRESAGAAFITQDQQNL